MNNNISPHLNPQYRQDFLFLLEAKDCNPNGDPDANNMPRTDPETSQGIITDVALKRKIRDYVAETQKDESKYKIYIEKGVSLLSQRERAFEELQKNTPEDIPEKDQPAKLQEWLCHNFFDIRMFGAVMGMSNANAGQVRGPLQITFLRSFDPVLVQDNSITRVAQEDKDEHGTFGEKYTIPYGLYSGHGFWNPAFAKRTGADSNDLLVFWNALLNAYELERTSSKGLINIRQVLVFSHESSLGLAPAFSLFDRVKVEKNTDNPRNFQDYDLTINTDNLPSGVHCTSLI